MFGDFLQAWIRWIVVTCTLFITSIVEVDAGLFVRGIAIELWILINMKVAQSEVFEGWFSDIQ